MKTLPGRPCRLSIKNTPLRRLRAVVHASAPNNPSPMGIIIDVDACLLDLHVDGHREAFNLAFKRDGICHTKWSPTDYGDLLRTGDGTGPGLVTAFFRCTGWPTELQSKEARDNYASFIYTRKREILVEMLRKDEVKLRDGAQRFVQEAVQAGAKLVLLNCTTSVPEDGVAESVKRQLQLKDNASLMMVNLPDREGGGAGAGLGGISTMEDLLKVQVDDIKLAEARAAKLSMSKGEDVVIDANLLLGSLARAPNGQWLGAVTQLAGSSVDRTVCIAGSMRVLKVAQQIGLACAVVPSKLASQGYFPGATKFLGFGPGGGVTFTKIKAIVDRHEETAEERRIQMAKQKEEKWFVNESEIGGFEEAG